MNKPIQVLQPKYRVDECLAQIKECLESGWTGLGFKTVAFEKAWKEYTGLPNAHFLNSATAGLHLAVKILKEKRGWDSSAEIITTPLTFVSTNHAILYEGLQPVFAGVNPGTLCLDPVSVKRMITSNTKAVMYVGLGGRCGDLDKIAALCREHNLDLILDGAHMAGTRFYGSHVGREATVSVFSFQAVKNLPIADAGMICFEDPELDDRARKLSWLGIDKDTYTRTNSSGNYKWKYDVPSLGYKYHGNSVMAAIGLVQLKYLDEDNAYRRKLAGIYTAELHDAVMVPCDHPAAVGSQHIYQIELPKNFSRDYLLGYLNDNEIFPGVHYVDSTQYPMYKNCKGDIGAVRDTIQISNQLLTLPLHLNMSEDDVKRVIHHVNQFLAQ
jgi:dTDP-4-amino-4,6-dideoxygalactose transaminase